MGERMRYFKAGEIRVVVHYVNGRAFCSFNGGPDEERSPEYVSRMVVSGQWRPIDGGL